MINPDKIQTPCYAYDLGLLQQTLDALNRARATRPDFQVHYAIKANSDPKILSLVAKAGLGADTVSGGEIQTALDAGFPAAKTVFAGVGKTDSEIRLAIASGIEAINVESIEELPVLAGLARKMGKKARIALRVNPDIDAHTHHYITTGLKENKFGIDRRMLQKALDTVGENSDALDLIGLHFHIGSQITDMTPYRILCQRALKITQEAEARGFKITHIDLGGGLGIDYDRPDVNPIPDFDAYFRVFSEELPVREGVTYHFEPGRSIVAQCGRLLTRVLYVKKGIEKKYVILDAGMTELMRPALYGAVHALKVLDCETIDIEPMDVVGPVCESTDVFATDYPMPTDISRGDICAFLSAGAYGQSMASHYNSRRLNPTIYY